MPKGPTQYSPLTITQKFKGSRHRGVDLRNYDFHNNRAAGVVACEDGEVMRTSHSHGQDGYGNNFIIIKCGDYELKYIHNSVKAMFRSPGSMVAEGDVLGMTEIGGNSKSHHLHFEVWADGKAIDPEIYFKEKGIDYQTS